MCKGDGSGFWRLVEHFLCSVIAPPTDFEILHHPVFDRIYALDRPDDSIPLHRAIRAYQEEVLLGTCRLFPRPAEPFSLTELSFIFADRHIIVLFLNGAIMKMV
jgi:hypothetical protein